MKRSGREADHLPPARAEGENECRYTFPPPVCLHGERRESYLLSLDNCKQSNEIHKKTRYLLTHSPVLHLHKLYALKCEQNFRNCLSIHQTENTLLNWNSNPGIPTRVMTIAMIWHVEEKSMNITPSTTGPVNLLLAGNMLPAETFEVIKRLITLSLANFR